MADPKMPPKPAMDDEDDDTGAPDAGGADDMGGEGEDQSAQVICTVLKNADGSYTVTEGDEDEGGEGAPEDGAEGAAPGGEGEAGGDYGQTFHEPGQVLKAVLDCLQKDQEASGGSPQSHFEAGFNDDNAPTPKKAPPPKY